MYTIKQASLRSGVNVALLRAWERRYGIVAPTRTESGYRLYDDEAIERLRAMRTLVDQGWSAKQAAERVAEATPAELGGSLTGPEALPLGDESTTAAFVDGAARIDGALIERSLDDMFSRGSFERIVEDRVYPALRALGDAWASGEVDVAGEHAASSAVVRRLAMAFEAAGRGPSSGPAPILVGLPPGSRHEVAALAFATAARRAGLSIVYLGADVPAVSWVAAVQRTDARAAVLGAVTDSDAAAANDVVRALRADGGNLVIGVGGVRASGVGDAKVVRLPDRLGDAVRALRESL